MPTQETDASQRQSPVSALPSRWLVYSFHACVAQYSAISFDKRAVPIRIEPIPLFDGMEVSSEQRLSPRKCADQHQQSRFRQMEISEQRANDPKIVTWINKDFILATAFLYSPVP